MNRDPGTKDTVPYHIWAHEVEAAAIKSGAEGRFVRAERAENKGRMRRWYEAGEPIWMAADTLKAFAKGQKIAHNEGSHKRAVAASFFKTWKPKMLKGPQMPILKKGQRCSPGDTRIDLRYYVVPNNNKSSGGWMPAFSETFHRGSKKRERGSTYGRGMDKDKALSVAKAMAYEEGEKFRGDYCVVIGPGLRRKRHAEGHLFAGTRRRR